MIKARTSLSNSISTKLSCVLNSLMWAATNAPSIIHKLNNYPIKCTLFEANGFLYILERVDIRPTVVFSFTMLKTTLRDNVSQITLSVCLSSKAHSSSLIDIGFYLKKSKCLSFWYRWSLICIFQNLKSSPLKFSILMLFPSSIAIIPTQTSSSRLLLKIVIFTIPLYLLKNCRKNSTQCFRKD